MVRHTITIFIYIYVMMYDVRMYVAKHSPVRICLQIWRPKKNNAYHYNHFSLTKKAAVFHGIPRFPPIYLS